MIPIHGLQTYGPERETFVERGKLLEDMDDFGALQFQGAKTRG
jgi:hypothetical protein